MKITVKADNTAFTTLPQRDFNVKSKQNCHLVTTAMTITLSNKFILVESLLMGIYNEKCDYQQYLTDEPKRMSSRYIQFYI